MTSEEIKNIQLEEFGKKMVGHDTREVSTQIEFLNLYLFREIAYQLAVMNERAAAAAPPGIAVTDKELQRLISKLPPVQKCGKQGPFSSLCDLDAGHVSGHFDHGCMLAWD